MASPDVITVSSKSDFDKAVGGDGGSSGVVSVTFNTEWAPTADMTNTLTNALAKRYPAITWVQVDAEKVPEVSLELDVTSVPTVVFVRGKTILKKHVGTNVKELTSIVESIASSAAATGAAKKGPTDEETKQKELYARLDRLTNAAHVVLFMKGSPQEPKCKFSRQTVGILLEDGIEFSSFDILKDPEVRAGLKVYSDWPTFPQLYVAGKLVGGLDIIKEMREEGELKSIIPPKPAKKEPVESLNDRLRTLINKDMVMLFMKGNPSEPKCGFSAKMVKALGGGGVTYSTFDILEDEEVRAGLKIFSNWPTFPQLYVGGKLVGGLDIVNELIEDDPDTPLPQLLGIDSAEEGVITRMKEIISKDRVVLFMKGNPDRPRCKFSRECVGILKDMGAEYAHFDILQDNIVRQRLKKLSDWPTYPQLYAEGKLVGGLDIIKELKAEGELAEVLGVDA